MRDAYYALVFFGMFGGVTALYGLLIARTGDGNWLPYHLRHTVSSKEDVRKAGRCVAVAGAIVLTVSILGMFLAP